MAKAKPFIEHNRYWIPRAFVSMPAVIEHFKFELDELDETGEENVKINMYSLAEIKGKNYVGLPMGRPELVEKCVFKRSTLAQAYKNDKRIKDTKLGYDLKFTWVPHDYQLPASAAVSVRHTRGVLVAPMRSGKTVMLVHSVCTAKQRCIIFAHQGDLINQFYKTFVDGTNLVELEKECGRKIVHKATRVEDFGEYPIVLATYQMLLDHHLVGKKIPDTVFNNHSRIYVDECHRVPADGYMSVLNKFNAYQYFGCSGTPDRKDQKYVCVDRLIGPIIHTVSEAEVGSLRPKVLMHVTGVPEKNIKDWVYCVNYLTEQEERNQMIVKWAVKDLKAGHSVLIPVERSGHCNVLRDRINEAMGGEQIAVVFNGKVPKSKREALLESLSNKEFMCTIAQRSMLTGVNVPPWSMIYTAMPTANPPNYAQETKRVCTPYEDKLTPTIRFFLDEQWGLGLGCARKCLEILTKYELPMSTRFKIQDYIYNEKGLNAK